MAEKQIGSPHQPLSSWRYRMRNLIFVVVLLALAGITAASVLPAFAQSKDQGRRMPQMLEVDDPNVGDSLPDVTVYADTGDKFSLADLKGQYTVLVFGCLT